MTSDSFCFSRLCAIIAKEFIQMIRDKMTFGMIVGIPLMQLILFGFAINTNPKHLPSLLILGDYSNFTRELVQDLKNTDYFKFIRPPVSEKVADQLMASSKAQLIINIPTDFTRNLIRGKHPSILLTADASDPMAAGNAINAIQNLAARIFERDFKGQLTYLNQTTPQFNVITHSRYNPELISQVTIVPGLMGVVLTMTMVMITALAITRERERGTMEGLLATPARPVEVIIGKVIPFILIGYIQITLIILASFLIFNVHIRGSLLLLYLCAFPFIVANLSVGITFSSIAKNQLQSTQMAVFFFLPSILLSGFMFPFYGMPLWAQKLGGILPLTYFLRIVRGIVLKGNGITETWPNIWPIMIFMVIAIFIGTMKYKQTLD
jgi:ABC-2 type transport system permease protein